MKSHYFVQFLFQAAQKEVTLWNNACVAWRDDVGSSELTHLKLKCPHMCVKPFCSWLGLQVGPTHQLLQKGRQAPGNNIDRWGLTAAVASGWVLMRFSERGSDSSSSKRDMLGARPLVRRLSSVFSDRQFSLGCSWASVRFCHSNFHWKISYFPSSSACNSPKSGYLMENPLHVSSFLTVRPTSQ